MKTTPLNALKIEQTTLHVLLSVGIVALLLSFFLEFFLKNYLTETFFTKYHFEYISTLFLGVSASSIIAYINLIFQYNNKLKDQVNGVVNLLIEIHHKYSLLCESILGKTREPTKNDSYTLEKYLIDSVKEIKESITAVDNLYKSSEFSAIEIDSLVNNLKYDLKLTLSKVDLVCSTILSLEGISIEEADCRERSVILKRAERDYYELLAKQIAPSIPSFDRIFSTVKIHGINECIDLGFIRDDTSAANSIYLSSLLGASFGIKVRLNELYQSHLIKYKEDCQSIRSRLSEIGTELGVTSLYPPIDEIYDMLLTDDIEGARLKLEELERKLRQDSGVGYDRL